MSVLQMKVVVNGYEDFIKVASEANTTVTVITCTQDAVDQLEKDLSARYDSAPDLVGVRKHHHFLVENDKVVMLRNTDIVTKEITVLSSRIDDSNDDDDKSYIQSWQSPYCRIRPRLVDWRG